MIATDAKLDSAAHDGLLGDPTKRNGGVMTPLPNGLFLWRPSCAEPPVILYPSSVVNAVATEAAKMQWAERKAGMVDKDRAEVLRERCDWLEKQRGDASARLIALEQRLTAAEAALNSVAAAEGERDEARRPPTPKRAVRKSSRSSSNRSVRRGK